VRALPRLSKPGGDILGESLERRGIRDVEPKREGLAPKPLDLPHDRVGFRLRAPVGEDDVAAVPGEVQGHGPAKAPAAAGDECDLCVVHGMDLLP
jgi:hypothetical protein